ncbi:hypothetical protein TcBrA4_0083030 [Trypanosoma cruzi]|nr:hypothetical protein TcBrA4_0083030 [Trypanosoma cruzi]
MLCKREYCNHALRRGFSMLPEVRAKQLGALSSPGLYAPRHGGTTSVSSGIDCAGYSWDCDFAPPPQQANRSSGHTVRVYVPLSPLRSARFGLRSPPGDCDMDLPFTPCALELANRDSSHGVASAPAAY